MFILFMAVISSIKNDFYVLPFCKDGGYILFGIGTCTYSIRKGGIDGEQI